MRKFVSRQERMGKTLCGIETKNWRKSNIIRIVILFQGFEAKNYDAHFWSAKIFGRPHFLFVTVCQKRSEDRAQDHSFPCLQIVHDTNILLI